MAHQGTQKPKALDSHSGHKHGLQWSLRKDSRDLFILWEAEVGGIGTVTS